MGLIMCVEAGIFLFKLNFCGLNKWVIIGYTVGGGVESVYEVLNSGFQGVIWQRY